MSPGSIDTRDERILAGIETSEENDAPPTDWWSLLSTMTYRPGVLLDVEWKKATDECRLPEFGEAKRDMELVVRYKTPSANPETVFEETDILGRYSLPDWDGIVRPGGTLAFAFFALQERLMLFEQHEMREWLHYHLGGERIQVLNPHGTSYDVVKSNA